MGTIADKLEYLNDTKSAIKTAITNRGVSVSDADTFRDYATKIGDIGETVDKSKYGVVIDTFLGNVDADGTYAKPQQGSAVNLSGISRVLRDGFAYRFTNCKITNFAANDIIEVEANAFYYAFFDNATNNTLTEFRMDSLEEINATSVFHSSLSGHYNNINISFAKLKKVNGTSIFQYFVSGTFDTRTAFPVLEEISGLSTFASFMKANSSDMWFPAIKKITGASAYYSATFSGVNGKYYFPSAMDFTGFIWNNLSTAGEIHFAAVNQAAIEACDGYANKWGFTGATIYFDL